MRRVFINGQFNSIDPQNNRYEAMACEDGKIIALGTKEEVTACYPDCEPVDLGGKCVLPGFVDAHLHFLDHALYELFTADLYGTESPDELVEVMKKYIEERKIPDGEWVTGFGWDQEKYPDSQWPTCRDLDKITDKHPIMLTRRCGTICVANSAAMKIAGIDKNTPDPQGGELVRFEDGSPNGVMLESAMSLIGNCVPKMSDRNQIRQSLEFARDEMVKNGVTVAHTEDFTSVSDKRTLWEVYLEMAAQGKMPVNLVLQLRIHKPEQMDEFFDFGFHSWEEFGKIKVGPIKFLGDGSLGAWSAGLNEPYSDKPDTKGCLYFSVEEMSAMAKRCVEHGFDLTIHAIGDAAVETFLDSCLSVKDEIKARGFRPSVIHSQIMNERIFEKYKELDAIGLIQPMYIHSDMGIADDRVGERMKTSYCYNTMRKMGIRLAAGSDLPIESPNVMEAIQVSTTRQNLSGWPEGGWYPEEAFDLLEAIKLHTIYGAYVSKDEDKYGSLEIGKQANFVVLSRDIFETPKNEIKEIKVEETYIDGEQVYKAQ
ncbi:MAG: amidohydrolase [Firmicutes bacterium]|nr:amidohydrolase [Bacillota bacterium]